MSHTLSADELLAGASLEHSVEVPISVLRPGSEEALSDAKSGTVTLRPLRLADLQRVQKAAKDGPHLSAVLMVHQGLVAPKLSLDQVQGLPAGLLSFLLAQVNRISGLQAGRDELEQAVSAPLARACFVLAREFGWTPEQCAELSVGQVLLYLEMLGRGDQFAEGLGA